MPPPRPYWKGYLKLSLVSCPINLYTATSSGERVAFRQINKKTGNRLRQQLVDEDTGEPVEAADKGRGYEVDKGVYMRVEDEELDAIAIESSHTIDIDCFVPKSEIDERYIDSPYYLVPADKVGLEAFAVIRDAMCGKGMVGLGRAVLAKRERVVMLQPWDKGLLATTLRYPYEVRGSESYFDGIADIQIPPEMLGLAEHILDSKAAKFDASKFHDRYEEAIVALINEKKAGLPVPVQRPIPRIVAGRDLMAALRQSIEADTSGTATVSKAKASPKSIPAVSVAAPPAKTMQAPKGKKAVKRNPDQREMLLPIAGSGPARETSKMPRKTGGEKSNPKKKAG